MSGTRLLGSKSALKLKCLEVSVLLQNRASCRLGPNRTNPWLRFTGGGLSKWRVPPPLSFPTPDCKLPLKIRIPEKGSHALRS
jgi:hypothetical protein